MNTADNMPEALPNHHPFVKLPLLPESEILRRWRGDSDNPLVSICCATFNHVNYIDDAIHGFLSQQTDFPFEIIIRDDASSDGTTDIILDYRARYPHIIRPIINKENKYSLGERAGHVWPQVARGKYIALCEGDDFWISPTKIQKQVALLERHKKAVMSVGLTRIYQESDGVLQYQRTCGITNKVFLDFDDIVCNYWHTSTYLIRSIDYIETINNYCLGHTTFGDSALRSILISRGPFVLLNEEVSVYRITGKGIWSSLDNIKKMQWEFDAAKRLAAVLPDYHGKHQRYRLFGIARALFRAHLRALHISAAIKWAGLTIYYGILKVPNFISRKIQPRFA